MGEVRQTNFRVDQDTADKFREFCAAAGMNQAQGFDHVMQVLELDRAKEAVPSRATEIEEYEKLHFLGEKNFFSKLNEIC